MIALPDKTDSSVRSIGIAGTKPVVKPVTVFSDEAHKGIQSTNAGICPLCTLFLGPIDLIQSGIDIHRKSKRFFGNTIHFVECLCIDTIKLSDVSKIESPEEVAHGSGMGNISVSPYCLESFFFSQSEEIIQTFTACYHTDYQCQDCFGLFISPLTLFYFDRSINNLWKRQFMNEFINEDSSSITDKVISFFNDDCSSFDFLHLHPPGDCDEDSLNREEHHVYG